jgi:hypothetical protein
MADLSARETATSCGYSLGVHECIRPAGHNDGFPHACDSECDLDHFREDQLPKRVREADQKIIRPYY